MQITIAIFTDLILTLGLPVMVIQMDTITNPISFLVADETVVETVMAMAMVTETDAAMVADVILKKNIGKNNDCLLWHLHQRQHHPRSLLSLEKITGWITLAAIITLDMEQGVCVQVGV
jgi:hypothetical protein